MSDIDKVKKLRQLTGAGFKDCNGTLKETNGDIEKAIELLRIKGISKASKKMSRSANEGVIAVSGSFDKSSIIEVNCETDFVAKNEDFISFVTELSDMNNTLNSDSEKLNKDLMKNGITVEENLVNLIAKIGEKITIGRSKTIHFEGCNNFVYHHGSVNNNISKLAVITCIKSKNLSNEVKTLGKQISMHIAASNPLAITSDKIDKEIINKEQKLITEELKNLGKSEEIINKISIGKLNKFKEENSLLTQDWVMEPKKKVNDILKQFIKDGVEVKDYIRFRIGD
tara:strand:+ start:21 stop:872 length:852 start_codon:yes stop_codon:yes gene_type:complete